jgi:hypothetical protein
MPYHLTPLKTNPDFGKAPTSNRHSAVRKEALGGGQDRRIWGEACSVFALEQVTENSFAAGGKIERQSLLNYQGLGRLEDDASATLGKNAFSDPIS